VAPGARAEDTGRGFPPLTGPGDGTLWMFGFGDATPLSAQGLGESLFFSKVEDDLDAATVLVMSLNELLSGTASAGGRCEVTVTFSDFALASVGFEADPEDGLRP